MYTINLQKNFSRKIVLLLLTVCVFTAISVSVLHFLEDTPYIINLILPPVMGIYFTVSLILLLRNSKNINKVMQSAVIMAIAILCVPAWYFTFLASTTPDILLIEVLPPISSIIIPLIISIMMFFPPRAVLIIIALAWASFALPILSYLFIHTNELFTPRGMEFFITTGPIAIIVIILLLFSHKMKLQMTQLKIERSDFKELSEKDALTGLYNRRAGENIIQSYTEQTDSTFSIIMFDIDHFKKINDTYGHDIGDNVLKEITKKYMKRIRSNDCFIRWGGEEFIIILDNINLKDATKMAEQLRVITSKEPLISGINVTASFGISYRSKNTAIATVLKNADIALYNAKSAGRNKVVTN